ncbi:MAG: DUF4386 domain-containing protein [Alphaproteobacteria bacterium]
MAGQVETALTVGQARVWARVGGALYLAVLAGAVCGNFLIREPLIAGGLTGERVSRIAAAEGLFRFGIALELATFAAIVPLGFALYTVLKAVHERLAHLALLWWVGEAIMLSLALACSYAVMRLATTPGYTAGLDADGLTALVMLLFRLFYFIYDLGLVFFALGSMVFAALFFRARLIPRLVSGFGVVASGLIMLNIFALLVMPSISAVIAMPAAASMALYELLAGLWLLVFAADRPRLQALLDSAAPCRRDGPCS